MGLAFWLRGWALSSLLPPMAPGARPPPLTGKDLPHSTFTHRSKYRFDFEGDSGKTVWFCLRYENNRGGKDGEGPFGPLFNAIIP